MQHHIKIAIKNLQTVERTHKIWVIMKSEYTFDHILTHDVDRSSKFNPRSTARNYKVDSVEEPMDYVRSFSKISKRSYSQVIHLRNKYDEPLDPLIITAGSKLHLDNIKNTILEIAGMEEVARRTHSQYVDTSLEFGAWLLEKKARSLRRILCITKNIQLPD